MNCTHFTQNYHAHCGPFMISIENHNSVEFQQVQCHCVIAGIVLGPGGLGRANQGQAEPGPLPGIIWPILQRRGQSPCYKVLPWTLFMKQQYFVAQRPEFSLTFLVVNKIFLLSENESVENILGYIREQFYRNCSRN